MRAASHCRALQSCRRAQQARRLARCSSSSCSSASAPTVSSLSRSLIRRLALQQATGERTALQLADAYLAAAEAAQPRLRAFVALTADAARRGAAAVDAARAAGAPLGPLAGVPLAVKDNLCTRGVATTAGSRILAGYVPPFDATAWARLAAAGCTLLGKTNLDEFGMGSSTESSASGPTANPWGRPPPAGAAGGGGDWAGGWVPGGSSGGSAAAVAASLCAAALGSDTGGSVRQPAAFCGVVGLKPTHGRVSRHGLVAYASSLDTVGPLAGCVEDVALLMDGLCAGGRDPLDATSRGGGGGDAGAGGGFAAALSESAAAAAPGATPSRPLAGVRVGVVAQSLAGGAGATAGVAAGLAAFAAHLESLGAAVGDASLPSFGLGLAAYYVLAPAEACSNLARYDGLRYGPAVARPTAAAAAAATRGALFGDEVKRRILTGAYVLSAGYEEAYYARAQAARRLVRDDFLTALQTFDLLLTPAAPTPAFPLGARVADPLAMLAGDLTTVNVNLAGLPALAMPSGLAPASEGGYAGGGGGGGVDAPPVMLPVGVQLVGRPWGERELLRVAHWAEVTRPPAVGTPPGWASPV